MSAAKGNIPVGPFASLNTDDVMCLQVFLHEVLLSAERQLRSYFVVGYEQLATPAFVALLDELLKLVDYQDPVTPRSMGSRVINMVTLVDFWFKRNVALPSGDTVVNGNDDSQDAPS